MLEPGCFARGTTHPLCCLQGSADTALGAWCNPLSTARVEDTACLGNYLTFLWGNTGFLFASELNLAGNNISGHIASISTQVAAVEDSGVVKLNTAIIDIRCVCC